MKSPRTLKVHTERNPLRDKTFSKTLRLRSFFSIDIKKEKKTIAIQSRKHEKINVTEEVNTYLTNDIKVYYTGIGRVKDVI